MNFCKTAVSQICEIIWRANFKNSQMLLVTISRKFHAYLTRTLTKVSVGNRAEQTLFVGQPFRKKQFIITIIREYIFFSCPGMIGLNDSTDLSQGRYCCWKRKSPFLDFCPYFQFPTTLSGFFCFHQCSWHCWGKGTV